MELKFNLKDVSKKDPQLVFYEAGVVGLILVVLYSVLSYILPRDFIFKHILVLFISGALFHLIFEYTGLNLWYVQNYPK